MKSSIKLLFIVPLAMFFFYCFPSSSIASDQWILHFKNSSDLSEAQNQLALTHDIIHSFNHSMLVAGKEPFHPLIEKKEKNYEKSAVEEITQDPFFKEQWSLDVINQSNVQELFPVKPINLLENKLLVINGNRELQNSMSFTANKIKINTSQLTLSRISVEIGSSNKWGLEARDDRGKLIAVNEGEFNRLDLLLPPGTKTPFIELTLLNSEKKPTDFTIKKLVGVHHPIVAILDSGVIMHEDFCPNILYSLSKDYTKEAQAWGIDTYGHGTHVTGILAACHNNGIGISGALGHAPIDILPMKVLNNRGAGNDFEISEALYDAIDLNVSAINISIAGKGETALLRDAIFAAAKKNIPVIAAAGNYNSLTTDVFPASYPSVITVSGINQSLQKVNSSNFGWEVDLAAPGYEVISSYISPTYKMLNGTSMAAPYVTGAAAILKQQYPEDSLIHTRERLFNSSIDIMAEGFDLQSGRGVVQYNKELWDAEPTRKFEWVNYREGQPVKHNEVHYTVDESLIQKNLLLFANGILIEQKKISSNFQHIPLGEWNKPTLKLLNVILDGDQILFQSYLNLTKPNALTSSFKDIPVSHWAYKDINNASKLGIINGYADQTFKPNDSINRRHATMILNRLFEWESLDSMRSSFTDIDSFDFISRYSILSANFENAINGYSTGEFKPESPLLRSQMALILYRSLQIENKNQTKDLKFSDVSNSDEFFDAVSSLTKAGIITNQESFRPYEEITRAQFASMISRANEYLLKEKKEVAE